jgi:23S rRNA (uracil1939-C5)-methyltransferase
VLSVTPEHWTPRGEVFASGREGRKDLLVWKGIPGERGRVRLGPKGGRYQYATWLEPYDEAHPSRVKPPCDRYGPCGSCPLMHVNGEAQREARRFLVQQEMDKAGVEARVEPVVASPLEDFRHVVKLLAGYSERGHPQLGAPGRFVRRVVPIPRCHVVTDKLRRFTGKAAHLMLELDIRPFDGERGLLRFIQARQSRLTGEIMVTLVATRENGLLRKFAEQLCDEHVVGVHLHINTRDDNAIFDRDEDGEVQVKRILGQRTMLDEIAGVKVQVGPASFFQTNPELADRMFRDVLELAELADGVPVIDLYSGLGALTIAAARKTGWALGIEENAGAHRLARASSQTLNAPAEFQQGQVLEVLPRLAVRLKDRRPVVVVDPARRGLEEGVPEAIRALDPRKLVYVSCSPANLARDLGSFLAEGWTLETLRPYDMFPNTPHVEVVAVLLPPDGGKGPTRRGPRRKVIARRK